MKQKTAKTIEVSSPDLSDLLRPYGSGWVALSADERRVVAAAPTLREAGRLAANSGENHPVFVKVLPPNRGYVPGQP